MSQEPPLNFSVGKPLLGNAGDPTGLQALPPITGGTPEQITETEAIRSRAVPEFDVAAERHAEMIANTFPDATAQGIAEMNSAAAVGIAEVRDRWLSQTSAGWWIERRGLSLAEKIEDAVKAAPVGRA